MKVIYTTIFNGFIVGSLVCLSACSSSSKGTSGRGQPQPSEEKEKSEQLTIRYSNQSTSIKMQVDPFDEDLYIDMRGGLHSTQSISANTNSIDTVYQISKQPEQSQGQPQGGQRPIPNSEVQKNMQNMQPQKMNNSVLAHIRRAQDYFYKKQYEDAVEAVNQSLQIQKTAEGYALIGSIYYMMDEIPWAITQWRNALELNPDMIEIQKMLEKIKRDQE
ncbi:MAG: tetratricopeptide repeat protein [Fibrobacterales bacterium]